MLKLNKLTDYAVLAMAHLARREQGAAMSAALLSAETGLPEPTVAKVLKSLARRGLLLSVRGVSGGYRLALAPQDVTIGAIVEAVDGPVAIVSCVDTAHEKDCAVAEHCVMRDKWAPVNRAIRAALYDVTLADMSKTSACGLRSAPVALKPFPAKEVLYAGNE